MKIIFTLESFFPSHRAGTEVYVLNLCRHFKINGWDVSVLISTTSYQTEYEFEGISIYTFEVPAKPTAMELNGLIPPRGIDNFMSRLEELNPDWVHFHSFGRAINGFHLEQAKRMGFKTAFTPHLGSIFCVKGSLRLYNQSTCDGQVKVGRCMACLLQDKGLLKPAAKVLGAGMGFLCKSRIFEKILPPATYQARHRKAELERIKNNADIIFAIAPWIQKAFKRNGIEKTILLPQGISPLFFKGKKIDHKSIQYPIKLVFVGRMHSSKGFHLLKDAWDQLSLNSDVAELHILTNPSGGETTYFATHKSWAQTKTNVTWNEGLAQRAVADYFDHMDVLILPSLSNEVAPLVILEAATRKIPVIASDYIAMQDMVQNGVNGWLFENGNVNSLKQILEDILSQSEKIIVASKKVARPHSMDQIGALVEESLVKLSSKHNLNY